VNKGFLFGTASVDRRYMGHLFFHETLTYLKFTFPLHVNSICLRATFYIPLSGIVLLSIMAKITGKRECQLIDILQSKQA
jgi:hypothetical protein